MVEIEKLCNNKAKKLFSLQTILLLKFVKQNAKNKKK